MKILKLMKKLFNYKNIYLVSGETTLIWIYLLYNKGIIKIFKDNIFLAIIP